MTEEQSLISVVLDQRPLERERVTSGSARRWKREAVVAGLSLSLSSEAWLLVVSLERKGRGLRWRR